MELDPKIKAIIGDFDIDLQALRAKYNAERDKRIRPDHSRQYASLEAIEAKGFSNNVEDPYGEQPQREAVNDSVEVLIIGGGFGGLLCGARLRQAGIEDIRIVEKGSDVGGTWYWNRYPGLHCDTEAYVYLPLLEEVGYIPTQKYVKGVEIREHCRRIANHFRLYDNALLSTRINGIQWDDEMSRWQVSTDQGDSIAARYVLMAIGPMDHPKLPGIPGINEFEGHTFHTSRWDYHYTGGDEISWDLSRLADKRVGLVGTAATGVQCVHHLADHAKHLYVFQRTPAAVDVRANRPTDPAWTKSLQPGWQRERIDNFNQVVTGMTPESGVDMVHDGFTEVGRLLDPTSSWAGPLLGRALTPEEGELLSELLDAKKMEQIRHRIEDEVKDPKVAEKLKPWHRRWCKRPLFSDDYLPMFNQDNVTLVDTNGAGINSFTKNAAVVDGVEYPLDCLIFATGYEVGTSYAKNCGYEITGRGGITLKEYWGDGMLTFNGLHMHGFPNCFYIGLGQNAGATNFCYLLDEQAKHAAYIISEAGKRGATIVEPTAQAVADYVEEVSPMTFSEQKFWIECTPSYFNDEGEKGNRDGFFANLHPAGTVGFYEKLRLWREEGKLAGLVLQTEEHKR